VESSFIVPAEDPGFRVNLVGNLTKALLTDPLGKIQSNVTIKQKTKQTHAPTIFYLTFFTEGTEGFGVKQ